MVFAADCLVIDRRRPSSEALSAPAAMARMAKSWTGRTSSYPRSASSTLAASTSARKPPSSSSARSAPERDMAEGYDHRQKTARVPIIRQSSCRIEERDYASPPSEPRRSRDHPPPRPRQRNDPALRRRRDHRVPGPAGPRVPRDLEGLPQAHPLARRQPPGLRRGPARLQIG